MAKNNGKRMVKEDLLNYLEAVQTNYPDPSDIGGGGGSSYTAGTGIDITNDVISVDSTVVALKSDLLDYVTTSKLTTELSNYVTSTDLATELLDYAELSDLATVATTGSYNDLSNKPDLSDYAKLNDDTQNITANNITVTPGAGYIHTTYGPTTIAMSIPRTPGYTITIPTKDGTMALTSDIPSLTGYATESWVTNQGYSTFSGDYNDLTNKPTIPDAVSGTNDGTNWTSLTIGNTKYNIPSGGGSAPSNMVTTNTTQTISGRKTFNNNITFSGSRNTTGNVVFTGRNPIKMIAPYNDTTGFTLFNSNDYEKGYLQYNSTQDALYLGRWGDAYSPKYAQNIGFLSELGDNGYRVLIPNKTSTSSATATANTYYIPTEITNGTTTVKASSDGVVNISSLIGGGGGTTVSGTNDGTNWTSLTIGSDTYGIPSGGGSGSSQLYIIVDVNGEVPAHDENLIYFYFTLIVDISNMTINDAKELYNNNNANYDFATSAATYSSNFNYGQINFTDGTNEQHIDSIAYDSVNKIVTLNYNDGSPKTLTFSESNLSSSKISSIANL